MATSYANYGQQSISGANVGGYGGYSSYPPVSYQPTTSAAPVAYAPQQPVYGGLAGYGIPRAARAEPYYNQASYSTSLSGDALAYATQPAYAPAGSFRQSQYSAGPVLSGLPAASSYGGVSGGIEQYGANALAPQIEAAYEAAALHRRQPVIRRQVIQVPGNPGQVKQIVRRVPTPIPDVIERVFVVKPQRDIVNLVIERPTTPPPQIKNRTIVAKSRKPVINSQVVRVAPRSIQAPPVQQPVQQQPPVQYAPAPVQYAPAPVQYAPAPVQYAPAPAYEYGSAYSYTSSFDTVTGGYPQQQYGGYSTGYPANYGLPAYAGTSSYSQPPYNYSYAQPSASYPVGYATQSNAYSSAYLPQNSGSAGAYPSIIAANPAGNSYYGYGYPAPAQYGYAPRY
jgi:hypothetical protein